MGITKIRFTVAGVGLVLASAILTASPAQKTTKDGVYTKAQADRAADQYGKICANCHDPAKVPADKKPAPPLVGEVFLETWNDRALGELLTVIRVTMPNDGSAVLTLENVVDLTAYILQANKFPEGKEPLKNDDAGKKIVIVRAP